MPDTGVVRSERGEGGRCWTPSSIVELRPRVRFWTSDRKMERGREWNRRPGPVRVCDVRVCATPTEAELCLAQRERIEVQSDIVVLPCQIRRTVAPCSWYHQRRVLNGGLALVPRGYRAELYRSRARLFSVHNRWIVNSAE